MDYAVRLQALCRHHNPLKFNKNIHLRSYHCNHRKINLKNFTSKRNSYLNTSNILLSRSSIRYFSSTPKLRQDLDDIDDIEDLEIDDEYTEDYEGYEESYSPEAKEERFRKMVFGKQFTPEDTDVLDDLEDEEIEDLIRIQRGEEVLERKKKVSEEEEEEDEMDKLEGKEEEGKEEKDLNSEEAVLDAMRDEIMAEMSHASDPVFSERSRRKAYELHAMNPNFWTPVRLANLFRVKINRMRLSLWTSKMEIQAEDEGVKLDDTIELLLGEHFGELDFPNDIADIPDRIRYKNKRDTYYFIDDDLNRASLLKSLRRRDMVHYKESPRLPKKSIPPVQIVTPLQPEGIKNTVYAGKHKNTFMMWDISPSKTLYDRLIVIRETDGSFRTGNWQDRRYVEDYRRFIKWPFKTPFIRPDDTQEDHVPLEAKLPEDYKVVFEDDFSDPRFSDDFKEFIKEVDEEEREEDEDITFTPEMLDSKKKKPSYKLFPDEEEGEDGSIKKKKKKSKYTPEDIENMKYAVDVSLTEEEKAIAKQIEKLREKREEEKRRKKTLLDEHEEAEEIDPEDIHLIGDEEFYDDMDYELDSTRRALYGSKYRGIKFDIGRKPQEEIEEIPEEELIEDEYEEAYEDDVYPEEIDDKIDLDELEPQQFHDKIGRAIPRYNFETDHDSLMQDIGSVGPKADLEDVEEFLKELKEEEQKKKSKKNKKK